MLQKIPLPCPKCQSFSIKKNGHKPCGKQNYLCKSCGRQFIGDHALTYQGCHSQIVRRILRMLVRGCGVRDISNIEKISCGKILSVLRNTNYELKPKKHYSNILEIDEFWTFVGNKSQRIWLIYVFDRASQEIVSYVWGKRNKETVNNLLIKLKNAQIQFGYIASDKWNCFRNVFKKYNHLIGRKYTIGIEGNNCRLRHRIRRAFRKSCNFSKLFLYHFKVFALVFFYLNDE